MSRERSRKLVLGACFSTTILLMVILLFPCHVVCSEETDTLSANRSLLKGQSLVSKRGKFEMGFFSPRNSSNWYLGIWYKSIPELTVVWVANRDRPIPSLYYNSSEVRISDGYLGLSANSEWVFRVSKASNVTEAAILDTGNFVLRNASGIIWQSFDYPTHTLLPGASLGFRSLSDLGVSLVSWRDSDDPSPGDYSLGMMRNEGSELFITKDNSAKLWRSGILQGGLFPFLHGKALLNFSYVAGEDSNYLTSNVYDESLISRIEITFAGQLRFYVWSEEDKNWIFHWAEPSNVCSTYAICGANALCNIDESPLCSCILGFVPKNDQSWALRDFSAGCVRRTPLQCGGEYRGGYARVPSIKLPENPEAMVVRNNRICQFACSDDCSCQAYAYDSQGNCLLFMKDIVDMEKLANASAGRDLYVRADIATLTPFEGKGKQHLAIILPITIASAILVCAFCVCFLRRKSRNKVAYQDLLLLDLKSNERPNRTAANRYEYEKNKNELPIFSFSSVVMATNNFDASNILGEGGFGPVYKGKLLNGEFVAIKRLSRRSGQGLEEFKTEMEVIAKLQHRNLVGILGCCVERDEMILVYEYMQNKSLDFFLFNSTRKTSLDWTRRVQIIEGVAQGLLYLHHYSRLRIVHRDLKASNILLDDEMNPKISDFGMARTFGGNTSQANTKRIVGTFGYMSPEYAMHGLFSVKSDIFAFGVLMLEIISGKKNTSFYNSDHLSLIGYAWYLWENRRLLDLIDDPLLEILASSFSTNPIRYIQIGLLCVQENASDRPLISEVVAMLSNDQKELARPKMATVGRSLSDGERDDANNGRCAFSVNGLTVSTMEEGR